MNKNIAFEGHNDEMSIITNRKSSWKNRYATQYLKAGKALVPLHPPERGDMAKRPKAKNWTKKTFPLNELNQCENLGFRQGETDLVIDVDCKDGQKGRKSFERLCELIPSLRGSVTVETPSGGFHIYLSIPEGLKLQKNLKDYPGIDFQSKGSHVVIAGSRTIKTDKTHGGTYEFKSGNFEQREAPQGLIGILSKVKSIPLLEDGSPDWSISNNAAETFGNSDKLSTKEVRGLLADLDPSVKNDDWVRVGMALHDWDKTKGLEEWECWSKDGDNYEEGETPKRWSSFGKRGSEDSVTVGSLAYMSREAKEAKVGNLIARVTSGDLSTSTIRKNIIPEIPTLEIDEIQRAELEQALYTRLKEMGASLPKSEIRKLIARKVVAVSKDEKPEWVENWYSIPALEKYVCSKDPAILLGHDGFNDKNNRHLPWRDEEHTRKLDARNVARDNGWLPVLDGIGFRPDKYSPDNEVLEEDGQTILNTFNPALMPEKADEITLEGRNAIGLIKTHIELMFNSEDDGPSNMTQWFAHQAQYPGKKIYWAPLIIANQGIGKTTLTQIATTCVGKHYVAEVEPDNLSEKFNGWIFRKIVAVLEELAPRGDNRYMVYGKLKPVIGNKRIPIRMMGQDVFNVENVCNVIAYTNRRDPLPLGLEDVRDDESAERRFYVFHIPYESGSEIASKVGKTAKEYFQDLYGAIDDHAPEIHKWFQDEVVISEEFKKLTKGAAPMTSAKRDLIENERGKLEGHDEAKELLKKGGAWFNEDVISTGEFFAELERENGFDLTSNHKSKILERLGYYKVKKMRLFKGAPRIIYAKNPRATPEWIEEKFLDKIEF